MHTPTPIPAVLNRIATDENWSYRDVMKVAAVLAEIVTDTRLADEEVRRALNAMRSELCTDATRRRSTAAPLTCEEIKQVWAEKMEWATLSLTVRDDGGLLGLALGPALTEPTAVIRWIPDRGTYALMTPASHFLGAQGILFDSATCFLTYINEAVDAKAFKSAFGGQQLPVAPDAGPPPAEAQPAPEEPKPAPTDDIPF